MNQMNIHGNMPVNTTATGSVSTMGLHMAPGAGPILQQQLGTMMQQQPGPIMQQPGPIIQQQAGTMMPQQPLSSMVSQQPGGMMPQQPPGAMIPQQPGGMMPQQPGAMIQQQLGSMMPQQPVTIMPQQPVPMVQQSSPQHMQLGQGPGAGPNISQPPPEKMDNISKVKTLIVSLRESASVTLKAAGQILLQNHNSDSTGQKTASDPTAPRFDKTIEEFYGICDQMELHLRTAVSCIQQAQSAVHYLPLTVIPSRLDVNTQETTLSYPTFLNTVRLQIAYAKDIHDTLVAAAQNIAPTE